jgi:magnesium-transporting ATPase (P-type)
VCARCEPRDKGDCARALREIGTVLAVGDGINDIDMIRAAHVGVGVEGKEGSDAVLSSDFFVPSFACLPRLMLVHGRSFARRTFLLIMITFYKNLLLGCPQLFYGWFNGFSATTAFDSGYFAMYNIVLTIPQHFFAAIVDVDVDPTVALNSPQIYCRSQKNGWFDPLEITWFYVIAFLHPLAIFFFAYVELSDAVLDERGTTLDHALFTQVIGWNVLIVFTVELLFVCRSCSVIHIVIYSVCVLSNFVIQYVYSFVDLEFWKILQLSFSSLRIWLPTPILIGFCAILELAKRSFDESRRRPDLTL